ncbi:MAG: hypothetical protein ACREJN_02850 [Nitrospiraceae bacterium]
MVTNRTKEQLWHTTKSGVVVPVGMSATLSQSSTWTYLQTKEKAKAIEKLYADNNILLPPDCALANLVSDAKTLSDAWLMDKKEIANWQLLFSVSSLDRIADAVLPLANVPDRVKYLTVLTSGDLDLLQRDQSTAKDILWELELWARLRRRGFSATLCEPDIVVHFEDATVGIACKKFYSDNNVGKVLSEGVGQIEATHDFGILALNLDDLIPGGGILPSTTQAAMGRRIEQINNEFLVKHKRHFLRYLQPGRVISAMVSTTLLADLSAHKPSFNIASQMTVWAVPGLTSMKKQQLDRFYVQLME